MRTRSFRVACVALCAAASSVAALDEIKGGQFSLLSDIALGERSAEELAKFKRDREAYGAFYVSRDGVSWAWFTGMFSQASADKRAKTACEWRAPSGCVPLARMTPQNAVGEIAVPQHARSGLREALRETSSSNYGAMAANGLGGWGTSFDFDNVADARERATLECEASSATDKADAEPGLRRALERNGIFECSVVHVFQKR